MTQKTFTGILPADTDNAEDVVHVLTEALNNYWSSTGTIFSPTIESADAEYPRTGPDDVPTFFRVTIERIDQ